MAGNSFLQKLPSNYFVSFLLWLISLAMAALDFVAARVLIVSLFSLLNPNHWVMSFVDRMGVLLVGLTLMIVVLYLEHYYRQGSERGVLWPRFLRVSAILLAIAAAGYVASFWAVKV